MKLRTRTFLGATIGLVAAPGGVQSVDGATPDAAEPGGAQRAPAAPTSAERAQDYIWEHFDQLRPTWGGAWIDPATGGVVVAHTASAPLAELAAGLGAPATLLEVTHTTDELDAAAANMASLLGATEKGAPVEVAVDIQGNGLMIRSTGEARANVLALLATAAGQVGVPVTVSTEPYSPAVEEGCASRRTCDPPLRAGLSIGTCTSGLIMTRQSDGRAFLSTAGHCTDGTFSHNGRVIGRSSWSMNSGTVDAQLIHVDDTKHWAPDNLAFRDSNAAMQVTRKAGVPSATLENTSLCVHGRSGDSCGVLVDYSVTGGGNTSQGRMTGDACAGDSGAAVSHPGSGAVAFGVHQGGASTCRAADGYSIFTWTYHLESTLGGSHRVTVA